MEVQWKAQKCYYFFFTSKDGWGNRILNFENSYLVSNYRRSFCNTLLQIWDIFLCACQILAQNLIQVKNYERLLFDAYFWDTLYIFQWNFQIMNKTNYSHQSKAQGFSDPVKSSRSSGWNLCKTYLFHYQEEIFEYLSRYIYQQKRGRVRNWYDQFSCLKPPRHFATKQVQSLYVFQIC